ncbi:MAG: hypothetical protein K6E20_01970 [Acholeplasmatales bacterium]|nr:hypothetical protein [Acholeplasmatales bacterium]
MNLKEIEKLIQLFEKSSIASIEIEENGMKIKLDKNSPQTIITSGNNVKTKETIEEKTKEESGNYVTSPLVGTYHESQYVGGKAFVNVGDTVKEGDTLCIIEAMKVMNEIKSPYSGKILNIYKADSDMVDYGANLFMIGE